MGRCYIMKRDKLKKDKHLDKMIENWKTKQRLKSNNILIFRMNEICLQLCWNMLSDQAQNDEG